MKTLSDIKNISQDCVKSKIPFPVVVLDKPEIADLKKALAGGNQGIWRIEFNSKNKLDYDLFVYGCKIEERRAA